jgi:hypothetical protein
VDSAQCSWDKLLDTRVFVEFFYLSFVRDSAKCPRVQATMSVWGRLYSKLRARLSLKVAEKLVFTAQNSKNRSQVDDEELLTRVLTEVDQQSQRSLQHGA